MSGEPQHPELIPTVLAYTSAVNAARSWGIVTGTGATPEAALRDLRENAGEQGKAIFGLLWGQESDSQQHWRKSIEQKAGKDVRLKASFSIGSTRLAYGGSKWVAYGTLFTDGSGDGTGWLETGHDEGHGGADDV
jgi:hypothetical protein